MKRITIIIIGLLCLVGTVYCQDIQVPMNKSYYEKYYTPQKSYYGYVNVGASLPSGQFKQAPSLDMPLLAPFVGEDGMGGTTGVFFDAGFRFPIGGNYKTKNSLFPTFSYGVEFAMNNIDWTGVGSSMANVESNPFLYAGLELGAGLSYNYKDKYVIEFNYDMGIPLVTEFPALTNLGEDDHRLNFDIGYDFNGAPRDNGIVVSPSSTFKSTRSWVLAVRKNKLRFAVEWFRYNAEQVYHFTTYDASGDKSEELFVANMAWTTTKVGLGVIF